LKVSNIFLDPDERYKVYVVKAAERPQLLGVACDDEDETVVDPPSIYCTGMETRRTSACLFRYEGSIENRIGIAPLSSALPVAHSFDQE
jgi:hypothetical protein